MYQKFIITGEGMLRFGNVYQHRALLSSTLAFRGEPRAGVCKSVKGHFL